MVKTSTTSDTRAQRSIAIDMAKGIAIVLVVYGHALRGLIAAGTLPSDSWLLWTDYAVYTFHMPLFFAASGLFFRKAAQRPAAAFWRGRVEAIAYPYLLWSILHGSIQIMLSGSTATNNGMDVQRLLAIGWAPISPFWFLYSLFFCNVLGFVTRRYSTTAVMISALVAFPIGFLIGDIWSDIAYGFLYFTFGMWVCERNLLTRLPHGPAAIVGWIACFLLSVLACYTARIPERLPIPAALIGMAATIVICTTLELGGVKKVVAALLARLGQYSMGIYVMHIIVLGFVRTLLLRVLHVGNAAIILPVAMIAALILPVAIQALLIRMKLNRVAGLPFSAPR